MDDLDGLQVIHASGHCAGQVAFLWPLGSGADRALGTLKAVCAPILAADTMMHKEEAGWIIIIFDCP